jgi:hypothetical protein
MRRSMFPAPVHAALVGFFALIAVDFVQAQSPLENLPRNWTGEFRWDGSTEVQRYEITIMNTKPVDRNQIEANGCGRVSTERQSTDINVRIVVDPDSLAVQIFESQPDRRNFTTDGSHRGRISKDLTLMAAEWQTQSTGQQGVLQLRAGGTLICPTI